MADAIAMPSGLEEGGGRASTGGGEANSQLLRLVARACVAPLLAPRRAPARYAAAGTPMPPPAPEDRGS